jgi:hypothetical protein
MELTSGQRGSKLSKDKVVCSARRYRSDYPSEAWD